jgi:hypothetical protein
MQRYFLFCYCVFSLLIAQRTQIDSTKIKNPGIAWKLSLIPGMGQLYNEKYVKSGAFILAGSYAYFKRSEFLSSGQIAKRNTSSWWLLSLYVWGILDAYVDAQLSTFPSDKIDKLES